MLRSNRRSANGGLGLLAASRTIDVFGGNCGLVAMKPFPLQFRNYVDPGWRPPDGIGDPKAAFRAAREKLRRHWTRAGDRKVNGTDYWALCPGFCTLAPVYWFA